jgi:hypothetical protein
MYTLELYLQFWKVIFEAADDDRIGWNTYYISDVKIIENSDVTFKILIQL